MKKKRKKKATSPFLAQKPPPRKFSGATLKTPPGLGSAPDVPSRLTCNSGDVSVMKFAKEILQIKSCPSVCGDVVIRSFIRQITERVVVQWDTVQQGDLLYVRVPLEVSKDSFIELLDFAEESLDVQQVIVCVNRQHPDFNNLIRTFCFMGFQSIAPYSLGNPQVTVTPNSQFHFLGYDLE